MRVTGVLYSMLTGIESDFFKWLSLVSANIVVVIGFCYRSADMFSKVALSFVAGSAGLTLLIRSLLVFD
jgi:lipoprotein signal peptidase